MTVITLTPALLDSTCRTLACRISTSAGIKPDAVIGIRSGGEEIARRIARHMSIPDVCYAQASRPGKTLRSLLSPLLRHLPHALTDSLRSAESHLLQHRPGKQRNIFLDIPAEMAARLACIPTPSILIVDDAVDSGTTLKETARSILCAFPQAKIISAVITITTPQPIVRPDFTAYDMTLVRFPWSADYREP